jgi:phosphopantothenoylcysteine decarboxylase/phosphopantothenate--cysteine ligase
MSIISGKKILIGISGGIAAYKITSLVRLLIKAGAEIKVIMTPASTFFVTPLTLSTLSKNEVYTSFFDESSSSPTWNNHVDLALWADLFVVAPVTANTLSKMATGSCDNLLIATYLSAKCPVFFAPAMDLDMYQHPSTKHNINQLLSYGNHLIPAESGELASGLMGEGRMAEPETIVKIIQDFFTNAKVLKGKKILITAGPTHEAIDPVRFISNHSTGKMGIEIADKAAELGATVTLVLGPTSLKPQSHLIQVISVTTAQQMFEACLKEYDNQDIVIAAAAVADYRPATVANQKIKKTDEILSIDLELNQDILKALGAHKKNQFLVGFALETENEIENAKKKIKSKNLDLIVLNSLQDAGAGFALSTNKITFIDSDFKVEEMPLKPKKEVASDIINKIISLRNE